VFGLTLTGVDDKGGTKLLKKTLRVKNPEFDKPTQTVKSGETVSIKGLTEGTPHKLYYKWTSVGPFPLMSGVGLVGETTNAVSFVAPVVTTNTEVTLRLAVGVAPISVANPGATFDAVVTIQP
jgi:hypothetical protein